MNSRIALCFVLVSAFAAACGGGQPEAAAPSNPSAEGDAAPAASAAPAESAAPEASAAPSASAAPATPPGPPGPGDWANKWSHEWKLAYMKSTVMPKMGGAFHDYDAKKYAEPKCVLCHGPGVADGSFTMPNPELPKLDVSPAGIKKMHADPKKKKILEFMGKLVVPTMADLVGEPPFDMKTMTGFGCMNCHTKKEPAAKKEAGAKKEPAAKTP